MQSRCAIELPMTTCKTQYYHWAASPIYLLGGLKYWAALLTVYLGCAATAIGTN